VLRDRYPDLYQFLAGRFNQDWDLFGSDDEAVIDGFLHEEPREFVDGEWKWILSPKHYDAYVKGVCPEE
jgi:CdiI immunity protein